MKYQLIPLSFFYEMNAKKISSSPPTHERSSPREEMRFPEIFPRKIAAAPHKKVRAEAFSGAKSPQLSQIAAESREPASAREQASAAERTFESSISAAVSSR